MRHLTRAAGLILLTVDVFWLVNVGGWWRPLSVAWLWSGYSLFLRGHAASVASSRGRTRRPDQFGHARRGRQNRRA